MAKSSKQPPPTFPTFYEYLQQTKWWHTPEGPIKRKKMHIAHKLHVLAFLERGAQEIVLNYRTRRTPVPDDPSKKEWQELGKPVDRAEALREVRNSPMYRALLDDVISEVGYTGHAH